ncbi:MAG TPA: tyrosine-type recombinase/integrase [Solirubrobacteraceae bacterium]|jgi:integrase|nr:tyrosine-type recombinase/integrase [Solirubrobacteraceae bacterium]
MAQVASRSPSGHVFRVERKRGAVWYAKYRLPDGRQVQKRVGPAWSERGRPPAGYYTKRQAEEWLREVIHQARKGTLPGMVRTGATFADAASEFLRYAEQDRSLKPSTLRGYRSIVDAYLLPAFGSRHLEDITTADVELWRSNLTGVGGGGRRRNAPCPEDALRRGRAPRALSNSSKNRIVVLMHGIFARACKVYGLPTNPVSGVERHPVKLAGDIEVFGPEEVWALVRAAASEQDGALYLTAAFTGLRRGELIALRWRDVDFAGSVLRVRASYAGGALTAPKSGKVRSVPLAPDVAQALARLTNRELFTSEDELVFPGEAGGFLDGSALRRRYTAALKRAGLRSLRFHDLRHTFGTRMIAKADIRRVQEWMGHADIQTTMRYLHYAPREEDARLVAEAFQVETPGRFGQAAQWGS